MPALSRQEAVEKLIRVVQDLGPDDLLDFHNEVFPGHPASDIDAAGGVDAARRKVTDYLIRGIELEEILDLWNVAFPEAYNVYYDDETQLIHYLDIAEAIHQVD